jgi:hypothetical protein
MSTPQAPEPKQEAITERARKIWAAAGSPEGEDLTFWLQAEKELRNEASLSDVPDEVIDLEKDTAYGSIDSTPNSERSGGSMPAPQSFEGPNETRKGTSL